MIGSFLSPRLFRAALALRSAGVVQALSLSFCFALAYLAVTAGLAPIVGAFAAGLVLENVHFEGHVERGERPLHESLEPLIALLVPVFFVRMGMLVDVRSFADASVLGFAALSSRWPPSSASSPVPSPYPKACPSWRLGSA